MKDVLVVDPRATWFCDRLARPGVRLCGAESVAAAPVDLEGVQALVTMGIPGSGIDEAIARMPRLEWVQCLLAGHEHLSAALAKRPEVVLTTVRGIHGPQIAETALLHMLVLARRVTDLVAHQAARTWQPWPQPLLDGRTAVVVGLGASGARIAQTCAALGMRVVGVSRGRRALDGVERIVPRGLLADVAAEADFLLLALPGDDEARGLVGVEVLAAMKPSAFVVNVGRGSAIDEAALVAALEARRSPAPGSTSSRSSPSRPRARCGRCRTSS